MAVVELHPGLAAMRCNRQIKRGCVDVAIGECRCVDRTSTRSNLRVEVGLQLVTVRNLVGDYGSVSVKLRRSRHGTVGSATAGNLEILKRAVDFRRMRQCAGERVAAFDTRRGPYHLL